MADLVSIGFEGLMTAIEKYNPSNDKLFGAYWYTIAKHLMLAYIENQSMTYRSRNIVFKTYYLGSEYADSLALANGQINEDENSAIIQLNEILKILEDPKNGISKDNLAIFLYYISNQDINKTAEHFHYSYSSIRNKIVKVRKQIANILFNSKE